MNFINLKILALTCYLFLSPPQDKIEWSENIQLTWEDFKGRPNNSQWYGALSKLAISYRFNIPAKDNAQVEIKTVFYPEESWVKPKEKTGSLLSHENLHFDIAELYARKIRKEIKKYFDRTNKSDVQKLNKKFSKIYNKTYDDYEKYQQLYDKETAYSTNKKEQDRWEGKIEKELVELKEYSSSKIKIDLTKSN